MTVLAPSLLGSAVLQSAQVVLEQVLSYAQHVTVEVFAPVEVLHREFVDLAVLGVQSFPHVVDVVVGEVPTVGAEVREDAGEFVDFRVHLQ